MRTPVPGSWRQRAGVACLLLGALIVGLAWLGPDAWRVVALCRYGPPWLGLVPLVGAVVALGRTRRRVALGLVVLFAAAVLCLPLRLPPPPAATPLPTWTLAAWNVEKYEHGVSGIVATLRHIDADVVCLTEAGTYFWHDDPEQRPERLDAALPDYEAVVAGELRVYSRLPVAAVHTHPLQNGEEGRPLLQVIVSVGHQDFSVFCMHGPPSYALQKVHSDWPAWSAQRQRHAAEVASLLGSGHIVLAGDFNSPEAAPTWRDLPMQDAWKLRGSGFGWTMATGQRVDRIFVSASVRTQSLRVVRTNASDHDALVATFTR